MLSELNHLVGSVCLMPNYEKMYFQLAAKVADAIDLLKQAQREGEESGIEDEGGILAIWERQHRKEVLRNPAAMRRRRQRRPS